LPEKILGHFVREYFRIKTVLGAISSNQSTLDTIFACIFKEFAQFFRDFTKVFTEFAQISLDFARIFRDYARIFTKSKFLGVRLHLCTPASYTIVHEQFWAHWPVDDGLQNWQQGSFNESNNLR